MRRQFLIHFLHNRNHHRQLSHRRLQRLLHCIAKVRHRQPLDQSKGRSLAARHKEDDRADVVKALKVVERGVAAEDGEDDALEAALLVAVVVAAEAWRVLEDERKKRMKRKNGE